MSQVQAVEGEVVPKARGYYVMQVLLLILFLALGCLIVFLYSIGFGGVKLLLCGGFFILFALFGIPLSLFWIFEDDRLVIGADRLQLLKGEGNVRGQVLFSNIGRIEYVSGPIFKAVGIDLIEQDQDDTFWFLGKRGYEASKNQHGYDITIGYDRVLGPEEIYKKIEEMMKQAH